MRLFIAISFPEQELRAISDRISMVKSKLPPASWVRPESQHLTFAFLGEQDESLIDKIAPSLEKGLRSVAKFTTVLHGHGFFPNSRRARVGWIGLDPDQPFSDIAHVVRDVVVK